MSDLLSTDSTLTRMLPRRRVWKYIGGLTPIVLLWAALVAWLATLLYDRANWSRDADEANVREWLDEARNFRKSLPELVKEYAELLQRESERTHRNARGSKPDPGDGTGSEHFLQFKVEELYEHIRTLAEPTRMYANQLPLFPEIYTLEVSFPGFRDHNGNVPAPIRWDSNWPKPRQQNQTRLQTLEYYPLGDSDGRAVVHCEYRLHAFNKLQQDEQEAQTQAIRRAALLVFATILAVIFVARFLVRERRREVDQLKAEREAEHQRRELAEIQVKQEWAVRVQEELGRKLLEKELAAARLAQQAEEAARNALELKSQLYASIGIMAGSYAHNIKNLLVRPNDLLSRCIEADGVTANQHNMLTEVKSTLGTVTERLQQILRTVRRDPGKSELTRFDLNELIHETQRTWADLGWDKWKVRVTADICPGSLLIHGDLSHLQQAIENLVFNARDATFEMRNFLREEARKGGGDGARRQKLLDAHAWKGEIHMTTRREGSHAVLEVRDNGIGMTPEVHENCLKTHYSTKRDNALLEGMSVGMGLGLSFVAMVLEHHEATLEIVSEPLQGALFRVKLPVAEDGEPGA